MNESFSFTFIFKPNHILVLEEFFPAVFVLPWLHVVALGECHSALGIHVHCPNLYATQPQTAIISASAQMAISDSRKSMDVT